jgi:UDP-2,3-diacylglucosamine pyrophosphatase LpxH
MISDKIVGRPTVVNKRRLAVKARKNYAEVVFLGDIHLGSPQCDVVRLKKMLDYCKSKGIYVLLMGDLIEMSVRDSVGSGVYDQEFPGQSQFEAMVDLLMPLAKKGLILGLLSGNHERRVYDRTGIDIAKAFARELKVPYLGDAMWNKFYVGKQSYDVYVLHGRTNARFDGTALLALERIAASFSADLLAMGHCHKLVTSSVVIQELNNTKIVERKKHLLLTGSYLSYTGSYAQMGGMPISKLGSPKAKFFADRHDIHTSL